MMIAVEDVVNFTLMDHGD